MHKALCLGVVVLVLAVGCGDDEEKPGGGSGGQSGGTGGSGASGGSGGSGGGSGSGGASSGGSGGAPMIDDGPAIDSAPAEWERPADCEGVGELCEGLGCGSGSTCQLEGNVCIPAITGSSLPGKTAQTPYCAAYTCMTFEQASCFCTGPAGETEGRCSSPEALAGLCEGVGASCADAACCDGLSCMSTGHIDSMVCVQPCSDASECDSGCCTDVLDSGTTVCAPQSACDNPCVKTGEDCEQDNNGGNCCRGTCVESDFADYDGCRPTCNVNEDCETGCCELFSNQSYGFCVPEQFCACGTPVEGCTVTNGPCCTGYQCVGTSVEDGQCKKVCEDASECSTGCCGEITGADWRVCQEPEYCGMMME